MLLSSQERELIEIVKQIHTEENTKSNMVEIRSRVKGFRDSDYIYIRLRKLVTKGVLEKRNGQFYILDEPPHSIEELTHINEEDWLKVARESDMVYSILYAARYYPQDLDDLAKIAKSLTPYEDIKKTFIELSVLFRLVDNHSILPRIEIPRTLDRAINNDDVEERIRTLVYGTNSND